MQKARDGRGSYFFHKAGRGGARPKIYGAGQGSGLNRWGREGSGRGTYCIYQLIEIICYSKGNLNRIALSEVSQMYLTFIILIVIMISIIITIIITNITIIIAIIINSTKDDIWDMNELFHKLPNFGEQSSKPS